VLFLRQVDDFACAASTTTISNQIIASINGHLRIEIKNQGILTMFNGMDIVQSRYFIKIHCGIYITKALKNHGWILEPNEYKKVQPLPYPADHEYAKVLDITTGPDTEREQMQLSNDMGIHYRQVVGLMIWPMVKCRPDYSFHITKLSQVLQKPAIPHYIALKSLASYLAHTVDDGIYYWRQQPMMDLPCHPLPQLRPDNYTFQGDFSADFDKLTGFADADWAACRRTRNAVTGGILLLAGGAVGFKTKFQHQIAHSMTDAEWVSAVDIGKLCLYFHSITTRTV
jgi:hypothetical protein